MVGGAGTLFVALGVHIMDTNAIPKVIISGVKSLSEFYLNFSSTHFQHKIAKLNIRLRFLFYSLHIHNMYNSNINNM